LCSIFSFRCESLKEAAGLEERRFHLPEGYEPQVAAWVWAIQDTRQRTLQTLQGMTGEILDWTPPGGQNNIAALLYHLVAIEMSYLYEDILGLGWSDELAPLMPYDVRTPQGRIVAVQGESLSTHLARLENSRALLLSALRSMSTEDLRRPRQLEAYIITPEWVLHHLMQHEAEHRGQIGELRLRAERTTLTRPATR
jgi:uncharacterized damage-inducible protein DinB